jgi:thioredoxin 1
MPKILPDMYKATTAQGFKKEVLESKNLSLVKFHVAWSGTCQIIEPIYMDLSKSYQGMVNFFTVDIEKEKELDKEYGIMELPTILFFKSGKLVDHAVGLLPKNMLIAKIEKAIESIN